MSDARAADIEQIFREHYGRAVSVVVRHCGDIALAEESVQDAFTIAVQRWPQHGIPPSPAGWIITTAKNRATDRLRREATRDERQVEAVRRQIAGIPAEDTGEDAVADDRLRLIFTCCHPAIAKPAQVALTLRLLGGLSTADIARAFLVPESTMAQRLVRAKGKIRDAAIPYRVPAETDLPARLSGVLSVVYLIFNEGYAATDGESLVRDDLAAEAVRLGRVLRQLLPSDPEVMGLLALMLLVQARREVRVSDAGELVPLAEQDRARWDSALIAEGQALVRECIALNRPGPYQLQAAIQAVHSDALDVADTDWAQIVTLYDHLMTLAPGPVVALNRAVAVAEVDGPEKALQLIERLPLDRYYLYHAIRADLLTRLQRGADAAAAYDQAIALASNVRERAHLERRRQQQ